MSGGNVDGYLLKIDGEEARIVYCILDEGILQVFTHMGGELLGVVPLTGCKVEVFLLPDELGKIPCQFRLDTQVKPARKRGFGATSNAQAAAMTSQRIKSSTTFAGSTQEVTEQWAVSLLNWNRYSWDDAQTLCGTKDEFESLSAIVKHRGMKVKSPRDDPVVPSGVSRAIRPL